MKEELRKCKLENEALIFDLRDSKTKVAVLEEGKAQLQMELAKEKKRQAQLKLQQFVANADSRATERRRSPRPLQTGAMSVELQPVNMQNLDDPTFTTLKQQKERRLQISTEPEVKMATTPQNRLQLSERKQPTWQTNKSQDRRMAKSPSNGMVPLAKKFSAFPASNRNQATRNALTFSNPGLISGGTSRNYTDVSASQKGPQGAALANRSFTNFTQQFHGGSLAQIKTGKSHAAMKLSQSNFLSAKQLVASRENSISNESCELSPDQETSNKRRLLGDDDDPTMREEIDADSLSMINPLVTPGPEDNRCSNF